MLHLPRTVEARLVPQSARLFVDDLLVSVHLFHGGRYYYGDTAGLTDRSGVARLARDQLLAHFNKDRSLFPMDYRVALEECDPEVAVVVRGGLDFAQLRESALSNPLTDPEVRRQYETARNATVHSTEQRVPVGPGPKDTLVVQLPLVSFQA